MPLDIISPTDHTLSNIDPVTTESGDQSGRSSIYSDWFFSREESLATLSDATHLQQLSLASALFLKCEIQMRVHSEELHLPEEQIEHYVVAGESHALQEWSPREQSWFPEGFTIAVMDMPLDWISFPAFEDSSGGFSFNCVVSEPLVAKSPAKAQLNSALRGSFEAEPLEDGMDHAAEEIIKQVFQSREGPSVLGWFREFCLDATQPSFAASVLRCLGRQIDPGTDNWRASLVRDGLAMIDIEIRDAAVQAAESWGESDLADVLESHSEPMTWLQDYIRDVIDDLRQ